MWRVGCRNAKKVNKFVDKAQCKVVFDVFSVFAMNLKRKQLKRQKLFEAKKFCNSRLLKQSLQVLKEYS